MKLTKLQGIVIKEVFTGEADKIITIFSKKIGKIQAVARGARRPFSRLIAGTQLLCYSDFVLVKGKELYEIRSCDVLESFYNIRTDIDKLTYASHIVELVSEVSDENLSYPNLLQLILNTFHVLANTNKSLDLVVLVFEVRLMSIIGFEPQVVECSRCGKVSSHDVYLNIEQGSIVCKDCVQDNKSIVKMSHGTLCALKYILYSDIKKIFSFDVSQNVLVELRNISKRYIETHLNKQFNKLKFLDTLDIGGFKYEKDSF